MLHKYFYILLVTITLLGLSLRLIDYDRTPPFGETKDEFIYPWAGMSLIQTGIPTSWSPFISYPTKYNQKYWGENFPMVSPYIEKPFLYPLLTGSFMLLTQTTEFSGVRLAVLRLIPIFLTTLSIFLIGLLVKEWANHAVALLAAILFATVPTVVLGNRLSLTENLLIPLTLAAFWLYSRFQSSKQNFLLHLIGILCGLSILTKQIGITLPISILILFFCSKDWKSFMYTAFYSFIFGILHPLLALYYGWDIYIGVSHELAKAHTLGLPETIATLFRVPGIGHKESIFLDGSMLLGFILFFSTPFSTTFGEQGKIFADRIRGGTLSLWKGLKQQPDRVADQENLVRNPRALILLFPFIYITILALIEGGTTWYGWHLFPLYPFLMILLAYSLYHFYKILDIFQFLPFFLILGASSLRFVLLIHPQFTTLWPQIMMVLGLCVGLILFFTNQVKQKILLTLVFFVYIGINIYTVIHLSQIYPSQIQPKTNTRTIE